MACSNHRMIPCEGGAVCLACEQFDDAGAQPAQKPARPKRRQVDSAVALVQQVWQWAQTQPGRIQFCTELRFHPTRMWRFDMAFEAERLAVEVDGGSRMAVIGKNGRPVAVGQHAQAEDYTKMNEAVMLGWRVLRFLPTQVSSGEALAAVIKALGRETTT